MGFLGFANVYAMRVNLSVAIVAMVNQTALPAINTTITDVCPIDPNTNTTIIPTASVFFFLFYFSNFNLIKNKHFRMVILCGTKQHKELYWVLSFMVMY